MGTFATVLTDIEQQLPGLDEGGESLLLAAALLPADVSCAAGAEERPDQLLLGLLESFVPLLLGEIAYMAEVLLLSDSPPQQMLGQGRAGASCQGGGEVSGQAASANPSPGATAPMLVTALGWGNRGQRRGSCMSLCPRCLRT